MFVGFLFWVLCIILTSVLGLKLDDYLDERFKDLPWERRDKAKGISTFVYTFFAFILPLFIAPFFVEFPAWPAQADIATFTKQGDLVYHPWGLWTPPWTWDTKEVVNARPGRVLYLDGFNLGMRDKNHIELIKDDRGYDVLFTAGLYLEDPKAFFLVRSRRRQVVNDIQYESFAKESSEGLLRFLTFNLQEIQTVFQEKCVAQQGRDSQIYTINKCDALTGLLESAVNRPKLISNGLRVKVNIYRAESFISLH